MYYYGYIALLYTHTFHVHFDDINTYCDNSKKINKLCFFVYEDN